MASNAEIQHLGGDMNPFSDAVSRNLQDRFRLLCRAANIQPVRVQVPERAHNLLHEIVNTARRAGVRVRQSKYVRPDPVLPQALLMLGRRSSACEEADAVAIGARLAAALGRPAPPVGAAATSHLSVSPRCPIALRAARAAKRGRSPAGAKA